MSFNSTAHKISNNEILNNGVVGDPDIPGRSAHDQQMKLDELATFIAKQKINPLLDDMNHPTIGVPTVSEMNTAISNAVFSTGSADMNKVVYDQSSREVDVFDYADTAAGNVNVELSGKLDPTATATVNGSDFEIVSDYPKVSTRYDVQFVAPEDFDSGKDYFIDGDPVTLKDMNGEPLSDAWKEDSVITLHRNGADAFFKTGGAGVDFDVVGGITQPASPKLNTIWLEGAIINEWRFAEDRPASTQGNVFIPIIRGGDKSVQPIKNTPIHIPIGRPEYYNSGAWVYPTSEIYTVNGWESFETYLFNAGNEFNAITGGYNFNIYTYSGASLVATNDGNDIVLNAVTFGGALASTNSMIDFTPYSKMRVRLKTVANSIYFRFRIILSTVKKTAEQIKNDLGGSSSTALTGQIYISPTSSVNTTLNLDISGVNASRYMLLSVATRDLSGGDSLDVKISKIELV